MSENPSNEFLTFRHLRLPWLGNSASVTAAIKVSPEAEEARVAFAFCSPKETAFTKRKGRRIAESRLEKRGVAVKLGKEESPRVAVKRGLAEALIQRFAARDARTANEKFDHWFPHWLLRSFERSADGYADNTDRAARVVETLMAQCANEFELHKQRVEKQKKRAATDAVTANG